MIKKVGDKYYYNDPEIGWVETTEQHYVWVKTITLLTAPKLNKDGKPFGTIFVCGTGGDIPKDNFEKLFYTEDLQYKFKPQELDEFPALGFFQAYNPPKNLDEYGDKK